MTAYRGPAFQMVEERPSESLTQQDAGGYDHPLLVKGAVRAWPAWTRWSFDQLAELRYPDGKEAVCRLQEGLVEQGATKLLSQVPVAPYLRDRSRAAQRPVPTD